MSQDYAKERSLVIHEKWYGVVNTLQCTIENLYFTTNVTATFNITSNELK